MSAITLLRVLPVLAAILAAAPDGFAQGQRPAPPPSLRLYVMDCGTLNIADITPYRLSREEIATNLMAVPCYLIAHPRGTLLWEAGAVPDRAFAPGATSASLRSGTATKTLTAQLADIGYAPSDIDSIAFSHFHWDHVGNANLFAGATWLVREGEREIMFAEPPSPRTEPANYSALRTSPTVIIGDGDHDVFGDGTVVLKSTPGHSPGHQVLFLKLATAGPIVLSGDLYHYPEERTLNRVPTTEFNVEQTIASRAALEAFLEETGAELWIEHDYVANARLKHAPAFYD